MNTAYTDLLLEAGILVNNAVSIEELSNILVEYANSGLNPDLLCLYQYENASNPNMRLKVKRGFGGVPETLHNGSELVSFLFESKKLVCLNTFKKSPFEELLLSNNMESGMALALYLDELEYGVLILNSKHPLYFLRNEIQYLEDLYLIINMQKIMQE